MKYLLQFLTLAATLAGFGQSFESDFQTWYVTQDLSVDARHETAYRAARWGREWQPTPIPGDPNRPKLLVLVDHKRATMPEFLEWLNVVRSEDRFSVYVETATHCEMDSSFRKALLWTDWRKVEDLSPDCVLVVGSPARLAAGFDSADGHEQRCEWSFLHLAGHAIQSEMTDTKDYTPNSGAWLSNVKNDGRYDVLNPKNRPRKRLVFSIDFEDPYVRPGQLFSASQPLAGEQTWPTRTADSLLAGYFRRNIAERNALNVSREVYMHGSGTLLWHLDFRNLLASVAPAEGLKFVYDQFGIMRFDRKTLFKYGGSEPSLWNVDGYDARATIHVQYKSYGYSRRHPVSCHVFLERQALVSVWGATKWVPRTGRTVYAWANEMLAGKPVSFTDGAMYGDPTIYIP